MQDDPRAKALMERHEQLVTARAPHEKVWQDIRDLVRVGAVDFTRQTSPGQSRSDAIYDGTAPNATEELAGGLMSYLTNPADVWFTIETHDMQAVRDDPEALEWLETVGNIIMDTYGREETNTYPTLHEGYLDLVAFGTAIINQEWEDDSVRLRAHPLACSYVAENSKGKVDTLDRKVDMTMRQLIQEFGEEVIPPQLMSEGMRDTSRKYQVVHMVHPRPDRIPGKMYAANMPFASCWCLKNPCVMLREGGYESFPYHVPRWEKLADEVYGFSPARKCLPDIKVLNRMEYTLLKAGQKAVDPPLTVPNDGFLLPIKTAPGSLNFKEPGADPLEALKQEGNLPFGLEQSDRKRSQIEKAFHLEWVRMEKKKERQSAYEIQEVVEEQLRMISPMMGRVQGELLSPMVARTFDLLRAHGKIPPAPAGLQRQRLKVVYVSPAARAQKGMKAISMGRYVQELAPIAQVQPDVMDAVDTDALAQELALARQIPRRVVRSPEAIAEIRAARAQKEQMAQMAEAAEPVSKAVLNLSQANQAGQMF